jgi:hypothetical protein
MLSNFKKLLDEKMGARVRSNRNEQREKGKGVLDKNFPELAQFATAHPTAEQSESVAIAHAAEDLPEPGSDGVHRALTGLAKEVRAVLMLDYKLRYYGIPKARATGNKTFTFSVGQEIESILNSIKVIAVRQVLVWKSHVIIRRTLMNAKPQMRRRQRKEGRVGEESKTFCT